MTVLWLDDKRDPANHISAIVAHKSYGKLVWVKSYKSFVKYVSSHKMPDLICFDHDLGQEEAKETKTGMDCAKWLVEYCMDNKVKLPKFISQSDNPAGKANILGLLASYKKNE